MRFRLQSFKRVRTWPREHESESGRLQSPPGHVSEKRNVEEGQSRSGGILGNAARRGRRGDGDCPRMARLLALAWGCSLVRPDQARLPSCPCWGDFTAAGSQRYLTWPTVLFRCGGRFHLCRLTPLTNCWPCCRPTQVPASARMPSEPSGSAIILTTGDVEPKKRFVHQVDVTSEVLDPTKTSEVGATRAGCAIRCHNREW